MSTSPTRVILSVPYEEKDQVKALGARWDWDKKQWWIPADTDTNPFTRWLTATNQPQSLYQDLPPLKKEEFEAYYGTKGSLEVVFVPWTCWKCEKTAIAFHGAIDRAICITHLFYQPRVIEELDRIRKEMGIGPFGCIKHRFSRTVGSTYISQGCCHCDALIGDHPLWEDFIEVFNTVDMSTYLYRRALSRSFLFGSSL